MRAILAVPARAACLALALLLIILLPFSISAQSTSGTISGLATDDSGGALPGVTVTATNTATGVSRTTESNRSGHYQLGLLPPGTYSLTGELSGFRPARLERVVVNIGTAVTVNLTMHMGVTETMTVTAVAPVVDTTRSQVSSVVDETAIENLPVNGRNFIDFVLTTPGVVRDVRLGDISFAGQRGTLNSLVIDGANNDNTFFGQAVGRTGSGRAPYQFSQDAVKEFQVNANAYSAEFGRAGGAVINVVTKSGTNDFEGSLFGYYRDKSLNANDYINVLNNRPKSPYHYDQYGLTAGGPIVRDRHFFFLNYDAQRNSLPNLVVLGGGRFSSFPSDPDSQRGLSILQGLAESYTRNQDQDVYLLKTDHELGGNNHVSLRYNKQEFKGLNYENGGITNSIEHTGSSNVLTDSLSLVWDSAPTGSFFNELRGQYLKDREPGEANSSNPEATIFQGGNLVLTIGRNFFSPRETTIRRSQIADTATYVLRTHTLKAGFDYNRDEILNYFPGNFSGSYRFNSLADFANGRAVSFTQAFAGPGTTGPITRPDIKETAFFVHDEWRVTNQLTVNAGLRYDRQAHAQPDVQNKDPQLLAAGYRTDRIPTDSDNFGPRLGLAWMPRADGRMVVRAGYGLFYGRATAIMTGTATSNNGINVQTFRFTGDLIPRYPEIYSAIPSGATLTKPNIFVFDPDFENAKVAQASAGVERQIGTNYSVGLTYQYVKGSDLPRSRDVNVSNPETVTATIAGGGTASFVRYPGRPFANFARVIAFESSARSRYDGVTLDFQRRFSGNWQARASWTHSTVKDNKPDATAVVPFTFDDAKYISDPLNIDRDYTYGDNDVRDRVVLSGVWALNSYAEGIGNQVVRALASGWTLSGIASYQTGQPYTPGVNVDLNADGNSRNDIAPGYLRNSLRLPSQISVDPRITREIGLGSTRLQLIAEAFNVFNRNNVSSVNQTLYRYDAASRTLTPLSTFGNPFATSGPRIIQLAARLMF